MKLAILDPRPTRDVPCLPCTDCCQADAVYLHTECGDDPAQYKTEVYEGRLILQHKPNGDCIYLNRETGCTIHALRPTICRELDCRELTDRIGEKMLREVGLGKVAYAARRLRKRLKSVRA